MFVKTKPGIFARLLPGRTRKNFDVHEERVAEIRGRNESMSKSKVAKAVNKSASLTKQCKSCI
jgi:hypothetical protein